MTNKPNWLQLLLCSFITFTTTPAIAQITPDNTLGAQNSRLTPNVLINGASADQIDGGATRGSNLFHSFSQFNINDGQRVYFSNPIGIENILTRVTGKEASNIFGTLGVNGAANLFLINPNGILFGKNAQLDIRGSFLGTTANAIQFGNQGIFSATNPQTPPLLTVNPSGLLFNQINQNAAIQNNASTTGLEVAEGRSLLLVGGNVSMDSGTLFAPGGRVELGGLAEAGSIGIQQDGNIFSLNFPVQVQGADVLLNNGAGIAVLSGGGGSVAINAGNIDILGESIILAGIDEDLGTADSKAGDITLNATGKVKLEQRGSLIINTVFSNDTGNGGDIRITTKDLLVRDGAQVNTSTFGAGKGGSLIVNASGNVEVIGTSVDGNASSALRAFTLSGSTGDAGNLTIDARNLLVRDGALVSTSTSGTGKGGRLTVNASGKVEVIGTSANIKPASGLFASAQESTGDAGDLTINTQDLFVRDGAQVSASTFGAGKGGNLTVNASGKVELIGVAADGSFASVLAASAEKGSTGNAGNLIVNTQDLLVQGGAQVKASTFGFGEGGNLIVNAPGKVELIGRSADNRATSGLFVDANEGSTGNGGNLTVNTQDLLVRGGAQVSASTFSEGKGGNLTVNASRKVELIGTTVDSSDSSGLFARANEGSTGDGGNLTVNTQDLLVQDGALASTSTLSAGKGGNLTVNASRKVELIGRSVDGKFLSSLLASAETGSTGDAGNLKVNTQNLLVRDGAEVRVNSQGTGNAGTMTINADTIRLDNKASLNANTRSPNKDPNREQATINLNSPLLILRRGSNITTNATGENVIGGNINIDTDFLIALENSDISANSTDFRGGRVRITAQDIFGTQPRTFSTPESDITATGASPQLSGSTEINTLDVDPTQGIIELPGQVIDASNQIAQDCPRGRNAKKPLGEFIVTGRGIPPNATQPLIGTPNLTQLATLDSDRPKPNISSTPNLSSSSRQAIVEAQGWVKTPDGKIMLVAQAPEVTPNATTTSAACPIYRTRI
ncbi:filamentous hemagglutinin N-terminal domain-containing protein [Tolypothrix sp. VBCCA 56010]|uniref:two-partner secretion domain-containing protein n=1 Tax=Tolypothrix sp. VBCCA 56010 TaxID=3137731 RepID=UPI003D7C92C2